MGQEFCAGGPIPRATGLIPHGMGPVPCHAGFVPLSGRLVPLLGGSRILPNGTHPVRRGTNHASRGTSPAPHGTGRAANGIGRLSYGIVHLRKKFCPMPGKLSLLSGNPGPGKPNRRPAHSFVSGATILSIERSAGFSPHRRATHRWFRTNPRPVYVEAALTPRSVASVRTCRNRNEKPSIPFRRRVNFTVGRVGFPDNALPNAERELGTRSVKNFRVPRSPFRILKICKPAIPKRKHRANLLCSF
jgi:hypothetical protein